MASPASPSDILPHPLPEPTVPSPSATQGFSSLILVGNPNVGKSVLFGHFTQTYVTVSNYPGTTVEISRGRLARGVVPGWVGGTVVDTPGTNTLIPTSEDEKVTRDILLAGGYRAVVQVGDAKNLRRALLLTVQLAEMGLPLVLCLNMGDEAARRGISIDHEKLSRILGAPSVPTVAVHRKGLKKLDRAVESAAVPAFRVQYNDIIEAGIRRLEPLLPVAPVAARALALMILAGDQTLTGWLHSVLNAGEIAHLRRLSASVSRAFGEPLRVVISRERLASVDRIVPRVQLESRRKPMRVARWLESVTTHPVWGVPVLLGVLWTLYEFVGVLGAGTAVDFIENTLFNSYLNPAAIRFFDAFVPIGIIRDFFVGEYGVITMALTYALAIILPIVATFFFAFGILEDSGYLPRLAVMVNRLFRMMGLNGKAVLPMVLGLGCDTMATLTTRILESRKERLIVILLLALGVPCSAQLGVILALLAALPWQATAIWLGAVLGTLFLVGFLASKLIQGRPSEFILELPPIRWPRASNILHKTVGRIEWYLKEAAPLFVLGTVVLFVADRLHLLQILERAAAPVISTLLSLPSSTAKVFIIGFLRRDFGAAGLFQMNRAGLLDPLQVLVSLVTITLFIPCIANLFMIIKERGWRTALWISAFIFPFALLVGTSVNWALRGLGVLS
ncbi:MAG: ferrous iron transport protein B [Acidobacteriota bacterium]